ncbi:MAG: hypothetical protein IPL79_18030 [Myxococcales bacterium]|nr:hypothetical protein [Myxococcales bacterium]
MKHSFFANLALVAALVLGSLSLSGQHAEANKYKTKGALAASVTKRTGSDRSTIVGETKSGKHVYVRSEGVGQFSYNGRPYQMRILTSNTKTRLVNKETGKITSTSADHQPAARAAVLAYEAKNGTAQVQLITRIPRGYMTKNGNQRVSVRPARIGGTALPDASASLSSTNQAQSKRFKTRQVARRPRRSAHVISAPVLSGKSSIRQTAARRPQIAPAARGLGWHRASK